ncbi:hypothetical protein TSUD_64760, partial [Trifolium subterraneum]
SHRHYYGGGRKLRSSSDNGTDLVTNLPGQPHVDFQHYAGYVTVNETNGRALFYWFYEAITKPEEKPLVLWLNGGPGCSSVGYGATQEIGPFLVDNNNDGQGLKFNNFSWNKGKYVPELAELIHDRNKDPSLYIDLKGILMPRMMGGYDPCLDDYATAFYNRPDVQKALHASDGHNLKNWTICNNKIFNDWADSKPSVIPIYKKLISAGLRIWVYSGDTDGRVPVLSTRYSLSTLALPVTKPWRPWYHENEVSGWYEEYQGLTFATFRGAGHAVPCFKPSNSLAFFTSFLHGESPPSTK